MTLNTSEAFTLDSSPTAKMTLNAEALVLGNIIQGIFYGIHMILFILYLVLRCRNSCRFDKPLARAQILLFSLCTIAMCLDFITTYFKMVPGVGNIDSALNAAPKGSVVAFVVVDYLAQMMLLYRCWIIWRRRWVVVVVPGFLALVSLGEGIAAFIFGSMLLPSTDLEKTSHLFRLTGTLAYSTSLIVNALTTSLIVTKIILTSREMHPSLGSSSRPLRTIAAMLIESGLLMLIFQLIFVILFSANL
ncbi:hypothetical protein BD779DRAFT_1681047 [Infundibulicybe gibba]|nr:hypothetical protein BD779DRAFT_1681047 [Infundibulicybe gibba]